MKLKLSHKLLVANISVILALTLIFLAFSYFSNKTLLSRAMNGIDSKVMESLADVLRDRYRQTGAWDTFVANRSEWNQVVDSTFFRIFLELSPQTFSAILENSKKLAAAGSEPKKMCDPPFGTFLQRLSLLDIEKNTLIPPELEVQDVNYQAIRLDGKVIGWLKVGKINVDVIPLAEHFFTQQLHLTLWATVIGGFLAVVLSFLLSRHITAPLKQLSLGARQIAMRNFQITIDVKTNDELQELAESFNTISRELNRYETQKKQWLMDISHELRTPITILMGEIAAICDNVTQCDPAALASLQDEVLQIKRLVDDLHDLAKIEEVGFRFNKEQIDLRQLATYQMQRYYEKMSDRGIKLHAELPDHSIIIYGDADRLAQVLRNLLENCHRYTDAPGEIWVKAEMQSGAAILQVEDSGPGVPTESLSRLFDRLYRADGSRNRTNGGAGLGLTICKEIVLAHGGSIRAEHGQKGGLCIRIVLPKVNSDKS